MNDIYTIRTFKESDRPFVMSTFLKGVYFGNEWFKQIPKDVFMDNYKVFGNGLLDSPKNTTFVACLTDDPDTILGYSIVSTDGDALHFIFVKKDFRKHGIGKTLVPNTITAVTHLTPLGKTLLSKYPKAIFNPFKVG